MTSPSSSSFNFCIFYKISVHYFILHLNISWIITIIRHSEDIHLSWCMNVQVLSHLRDMFSTTTNPVKQIVWLLNNRYYMFLCMLHFLMCVCMARLFIFVYLYRKNWFTCISVCVLKIACCILSYSVLSASTHRVFKKRAELSRYLWVAAVISAGWVTTTVRFVPLVGNGGYNPWGKLQQASSVFVLLALYMLTLKLAEGVHGLLEVSILLP